MLALQECLKFCVSATNLIAGAARLWLASKWGESKQTDEYACAPAHSARSGFGILLAGLSASDVPSADLGRSHAIADRESFSIPAALGIP